MNSFFETTHPFITYGAEHWIVLGGFTLFCIWLFRYLRPKEEKLQRNILLTIALVVSAVQLIKIPLDMYAGVFDATKHLPFHMCSFLPFVLAWVYYSKSRAVWGVIFFWSILGAGQANFTPGVELSLFHYEALRFWIVHLFTVPLAIFPALLWKWNLEFKDIGRTVIALNITAFGMCFLNLLLGSNYMYVMGKPPKASVFDILPEWPYYILVLEVVIAVWALLLFGVFKGIRQFFKKRVNKVSP